MATAGRGHHPEHGPGLRLGVRLAALPGRLHLGCLSGRIMTRRGGGVTFGLPSCLVYVPTIFRRIYSKFREKMQKSLEIH